MLDQEILRYRDLYEPDNLTEGWKWVTRTGSVYHFQQWHRRFWKQGQLLLEDVTEFWFPSQSNAQFRPLIVGEIEGRKAAYMTTEVVEFTSTNWAVSQEYGARWIRK